MLRTTCKNPDDLNTLPSGFTLDEADPPHRLAAKGQHPFSRYQLTFLLEEVEPGRTRLTAESRAAFPGILGRIYKALVIGSGGHALLVRNMLRRTADEARNSK
ncbi:SRPBCC family protein [Nocardia sp. IFM 10818]